MGLKTILVCLTKLEDAETLMRAAVPLARKHNAHLVGLHTIEALIVYPGIAMHIPGEVYVNYNTSQEETAAEIEKVFVHHTKNEDFASEWRLLHSESVTAADRMVESARMSDLVIMVQEERKWDQADHSHAQDMVIRTSGRPVIVVPPTYDGPGLGASVLLGWSDTREAARAGHDLLALADPGAKLTVIRVGGPQTDEMADFSANGLAEMYDRHGLAVTVMHRPADGRGIAEVLNEQAFEQGADLIVTGAFGHSKTYDFVVGAATYDLLRNAKLPVLFSK